MDELLTSLRYKSEGTDIDFKSAQYRFNGATEEVKAEILKDVLAMANAWRDGPGYILLGFKDQRPHPAEVVGIFDSIDDAQLQQFINSKVKPKITFRYEEHIYDGKTIGMIIIPKQRRAFYLAHAYGKLKSNVVYVRRGSSTDEAEPPEITAMTLADAGRSDIQVDLSILTPDNNELPENIELNYIRLLETFPDYEGRRRSEYEIASIWHANRSYWREYAEYIKLKEATIEMKFVLRNRSAIQLSNAKLEVSVELLSEQRYQMIVGSDMAEEPRSQWSQLEHMSRLPDIRINQNPRLIVDNEGLDPICQVRFGLLLPGEEGRSTETLAIILESPGTVRLRFRLLGSELGTPHESERIINCTGPVKEFDFEDFKKFISEKD